MHSLTEQAQRILIIDDNPSIHDDYRKILNAPKSLSRVSAAEAEFFGTPESEDSPPMEDSQALDIQLDSAFQGQEALRMVELALVAKQPYSMAFVDMRMPPGWDGLRTVQEIWEVQPDLQVVICTAYSDNSWDDICQQIGYTDQLLVLKKPFANVEVAQLAIALTRKWTLTHYADLRQRDLERMVKERTAKLRLAAMRDGLTGLANRSNFYERLEAELTNHEDGKGAAILLIDLDGFKNVNDSFGHHVGDQLIREVARRLQAVVGKSGCLARLGGDEFAVLQSRAPDADIISALVNRLFEAMEEQFEIDGHRIQMAMSCGIAVAPIDGTISTEIMKNADFALYRAKADGRNCYRFFEKEMDRQIKHRMQIAIELKQAITDQQFTLRYQPVLKSSTGKVAYFEALLRWNHPQRGPLPPAEFLDVAENTGLTGPIGNWVIEQACTDAMQFPDGLGVAVNISVVQFRQNTLLTSVSESLTRTGLCPSRLNLEIVESVLLQNTDTVMRTVEQLQSLGVKIAMDDFGTGYSSLSYLRTFPFDILKLDRAFVRDTPNCQESMGIIRAVALLGKCLNLELVAEGIETREQLDCMIAGGYDYTQGYFHSRPMPLEKAIQWARDRR